MKPIRARYKIIGAVLIVLAVIAIVTPLAIEFYLVKWLRSAGATNAEIGTVGMNLATGELTIRDLRADDPGGERRLQIGEVSVNLAWLDLIRGRVGIDGAHLQDARVDIERRPDAVLVGGLRFPLPDPDSAPPTTDSEPVAMRLREASISNVTVAYADAHLHEQVIIQQLTVGDAATWLSLEPSPVDIALGLGSGTASIDGSIRPFADEVDIDLALNVDAVDISAYEELLSGFGISGARGLLEVSGEANLRLLATGVAGNISLNASLASASLALPAHSVDQISGSVHMNGSATLMADAVGQGFDAIAQVRLTDAGARINDLEAGFDELTSDIKLTYQTSDEPTLKGIASLALEEFSGSIQPSDAALIRLGSLDIEALDFSLDSVQLTGATLSDLQALQYYHPEGIRVPTLAIGPTSVTLAGEDRGLRVSIGHINLSGTRAHLARQEDGRLLYGSVVDDLRQAAGVVEKPPAATETSAPTLFRLGGLRVEQAELEIHDLAVSPPLVTNIKPFELTVGTIDTSEPEGRTSLSFALSQDDLMTVKLEGDTTVTAPEPSADLALNLSGLQLHQITAYIPGYQISRGRLGLDSVISLRNGELDIGNKMVIDDLRIAAKAGDGVPALSTTLAMPLDLALDLLRDGDGRITLEIPVTGNLDNPEFSLDDVIATAMGRAMQKAAMSYVKNALQPLGALLMVTNLAQKAARPRFDPVGFDAGESFINQSGREYLRKMSSLLTSRPGLTISVCGVATESDRQIMLDRKQKLESSAPADTQAEPANEATTEMDSGTRTATITAAEMIALANDRASAVTNYFIGTHDLEPDRIFSCSSTIEPEQDAAPRVKLLL